MKDPSRVARIAHEAGASDSSHIQRVQLLQPLEPRPQWASPADVVAAREILVQQRTQSEAWKDPTKQKRRFLRTRAKNESLANPGNWTFSRAERSVALDGWIRQLGAVGVAQALLDFDEPLDVNLIETESRDKASELQVPEENDWLEYVADKGSVDHVVLLASYQTRQSAKDRALATALKGRSLSVAKELLRYGANPNKGLSDAYFLPAVVEGDLDLVELFLSAPNPLTNAAMSAGLVKAVEACNSLLVSLMLAHGVDVNYDDGKALESAVLKNRFQDLALICWKTQRPLSSAAFSKAISTSCTIQDKYLRNSTVNLLLCAGADPDHPALVDLLLQAAKVGSTSTVSLLIAHGTSPNRRDGESLQVAVQARRIDIVEIILQSNSISSTSTSKALQQIPEEASENEFRKLASCLIKKGVTEEALNSCLSRVVGTQRLNFFVPTLVKEGACLDYDDAACVRFALREQNLSLLETLLTAPCAASNLAKAIPDAMAIPSWLVRRNTMDLLLRKGVSGPELHRALRTAVGEADGRRVDYELSELLIRFKASVDFVGSNGNCLHIAVQRRDLKAIELLCRGQPSSDTTSAALPLVLNGSGGSSNYDHADTYNILSLLLRHDACGDPLAQALIDAVQQGCDGRIISLLLDNGADVNYKNARAVEYALYASELTTLKLICENGRLEKGSLERLLPRALDPVLFSIDKLGWLLRCCVQFREVLDSTLLLEVASMGRRQEVIEMLLELGASVDHMEAAALGNTVRDGDIDTTKILLFKNPARNHLPGLLKIASKIDGSKRQKLGMMQFLLSHGGTGIGQDDVLIQEVGLLVTQEDDLSCIKLLLDNGASVDYQYGAPIQTALDRNHIPVFDLFISQKPTRVSLVNAFSAGRRNTAFTVQERWHVFDSLFRAGMGGSADAESASLALIEAVERDPSDTSIPSLLVNNGASTEYEQGRALQSAVLSASASLVELFLHHQEQRLNNNLINRAFGSMISARSIDLPGGFKTAQFLLEHGVQKSLIDNAMSKTFSTTTGYPSKKEVGLFLSYGADVNAANGTYFVQAAQKEDVELFHTLVVNGKPDISVIIPELIQSIAPEKVLVRYLRVLLANKPSNVRIDPCALFLAIKRFPRGEELVRLLFEYGCATNSTAVATISPVMGSENVNIVVWALLRGNPKVSDEVVVAILQAGNEDASFMTPKTRLSPTILAAQSQRHAVLRELVAQKADVSCRDHQNQSALFYAARNGDRESVKILIHAGARPDDGGLHEAAREVHPKIVSLLLSAGHEASFPSLLHSDESCFGRTALEELCLKAYRTSDDNGSWNTKLRETIGMLLPRSYQGTEMKKNGNQKSILHVALDNPHPFDVTEALLEFPQIWKFINEPIHQFESSDGLVYSPTKYVENFYRGPQSDAKELIWLLRGKRCQDVYYSTRPDNQPDDAVGVPEEIAKEIANKKRMDREQEYEMERVNALAAHQRKVRMQAHEVDLRMSDERHEQTMKQVQDRETWEQRVMQDKHNLIIIHEQNLGRQRRNELQEDSQLRIRLLSDESVQKQSLLEAQRNGELNYKGRLLIQEREAEQAKMEIQRKLMWERDQIEEKQHGRQIQWIERQDLSVKNRAAEMRAVAEAARTANMPPSMLQLEGPD